MFKYSPGDDRMILPDVTNDVAASVVYRAPTERQLRYSDATGEPGHHPAALLNHKNNYFLLSEPTRAGRAGKSRYFQSVYDSPCVPLTTTCGQNAGPTPTKFGDMSWCDSRTCAFCTTVTIATPAAELRQNLGFDIRALENECQCIEWRTNGAELS